MAKTRPARERPARQEIRELRAADLGNGFLETIANLSDLEGLTVSEARAILRAMELTPLYHVLVAVTPDGGVIGATTLLVEQKFIHRGGLVGHIEDVVVRKGYEGRGVGGSLVKKAVATAKELGCYKCILDCKSELVGFYEMLGLSKRDVGMRIDLKPRRPRAG
jgi:glucosamine-phosphate N-acetyltransferase